MARRRELADVADGISGHVILDSPANPDWPLAYIAQAVRSGAGTKYAFDMVDGTSEPVSKHVRSVAEMLQRDLIRHLDARRLPRDWVQEAGYAAGSAPEPIPQRTLVFAQPRGRAP